MRSILLAGIAAVALAAGPALAQDKGKGGGRGHEAHGQGAKPDKGHGSEQRGNQEQRDNRPDRGDRGATRQVERSDNRAQRADDRVQRADVDRDRGHDNRPQRIDDRGHGNDGRAIIVDRSGGDRGLRVDDDFRRRDVFAARSRGLIAGCPPGLAKKNNGCQPPGQARQQDADWRRSLYRPDWWACPAWRGDPISMATAISFG